MAITSGVGSFIVATMTHVQEVLSADESSNLLKVALKGGFNKWSALFHSGDHDPCPRSIICRCVKQLVKGGFKRWL